MQLTKIKMHGTKKLFTTLLKQDSSHLTVQSNSMTKTSGTQNNNLVA